MYPIWILSPGSGDLMHICLREHLKKDKKIYKNILKFLQGYQLNTWKFFKVFSIFFPFRNKGFLSFKNIHFRLFFFRKHTYLYIFYWKRIRRTFKRFSSTIVSLKLRAHQEERAEYYSYYTYICTYICIARLIYRWNVLKVLLQV